MLFASLQPTNGPYLILPKKAVTEYLQQLTITRVRKFRYSYKILEEFLQERRAIACKKVTRQLPRF